MQRSTSPRQKVATRGEKNLSPALTIILVGELIAPRRPPRTTTAGEQLYAMHVAIKLLQPSGEYRRFLGMLAHHGFNRLGSADF
jgi:hypothetical protein